MVGLCALHFLLTATWYDHSMVFGGTALGALAAAFAMGAHGVLRLRAWGLFAGIVASAVAVGLSLSGNPPLAPAADPGWTQWDVAALAALPGYLLALPLVLAWRARHASPLTA
jgi:hypothetical protein